MSIYIYLQPLATELPGRQEGGEKGFQRLFPLIVSSLKKKKKERERQVLHCIDTSCHTRFRDKTFRPFPLSFEKKLGFFFFFLLVKR